MTIKPVISGLGMGVLACLPLSVDANSDPLMLVENGRAVAKILIAETPSASAHLAAHELQHYVEKITGATLPIVKEPAEVQGTAILVGASRATETLGLTNDAFEQTEYLIETRPDRLILIGRDAGHWEGDYHGELEFFTSMRFGHLGSCYAVHTFLEKYLSVRWYLPTPIGEVVPKRKTIALDSIRLRRMPKAMDNLHDPPGINRRLYISDYQNIDLDYDRGDFDQRAGVLYFIRNKRWGCKPMRANHSFGGWDHAYGKDHPDWFSTQSWQKMQQLPYHGEVQPVLSNDALFDEMIRVIRGFFDGEPEPFPGAHFSGGGNWFGLALNDGGGWSLNPRCALQYEPQMGPKGHVSRYFWTFVNRVARQITATDPQAEIVGLAYSAYTRPPRNFKLQPNVSVQVCRFPMRYWHRGYKESDYDDIETWIASGAKHIYTWEYVLWPNMNIAFPPVLPRTTAEDAKWLTRHRNFAGGKIQLSNDWIRSRDGARSGMAWLNPQLDFFRLYFRLKIYDDPTLEVDPLLDEFYELFYGPAAAEARAFVEAMEDRWNDADVRAESGGVPWHYGDQSPNVFWNHLGTPAFIEHLTVLMDRARAAAPAGTVYAQRVDLLDKAILGLVINSRKNFERSGGAVTLYGSIEGDEKQFARTVPDLPRLTVERTAAPVIDGRPNDEAWQAVSWQPITRTNTNTAAEAPSRFKAIHDGDHLYLVVTCEESLTGKLVDHGRDGPFVIVDDAIEVFLDEDATDSQYLQLAFNARGRRYSYFPHERDARKTSHSAVQVSIVPQESWTAEIAIPWQKIFGTSVPEGKTWRLNVCRNRRVADMAEFTNWSVTLGGYHHPGRFGFITFAPAGDTRQ